MTLQLKPKEDVAVNRLSIRRLVESAVALVLLIVLVPIILVLIGLVWIAFGRPIFFWQVRPGLAGKPFQMVKFRSMNDARGSDGQVLEDKDRLTRFGRFLRASSLDELPELWNVVVGDMSFVGPRPLLMEYLELYDLQQMRRHEVRPGITGWAQINGRNGISWEEKLRLDVWYVDNCSLALDIKIMLVTFLRLLKPTGIRGENSATVEKFRGTRV